MVAGPVEPWQPPRLFTPITKKRSVSIALPGPDHVVPPADLLRAVRVLSPATWWLPESAWQTSTALERSAFSVP